MAMGGKIEENSYNYQNMYRSSGPKKKKQK